MQAKPFLPLIILSALIFSGCSSSGYNMFSNSYDPNPTYFETQESTLISGNYDAADALIGGIGSDELPEDSPFFIDNFQNISSPGEANPFGEVLANQLRQRFIQKGYTVKAGHARNITQEEVKRVIEMRKQYFQAKQNHSAFSSAKEPQRPAVLTGSYALGNNEVYVSAEIIRIDDGTVISGHNWVIPATDDVRRFLLREQQFQGLSPSTSTSIRSN